VVAGYDSDGATAYFVAVAALCALSGVLTTGNSNNNRLPIAASFCERVSSKSAGKREHQAQRLFRFADNSYEMT
jgi:hypothetical protein